jgi:FtsZ-binding cell division protein ZapB
MTEKLLDCTKKCPVHCIVELDTLLKEKLQLQKENELLIQQLLNHGLKHESVGLDLITELSSLSSSSSDIGKLLLEIEALKLENKELKSRIDRLEQETNRLEQETNRLKKEVVSLEESNIKILKKLYSYAPVFFRLQIEKLLTEIEHTSQILDIDYLRDLSKYFSSFMHKKSTNQLKIDPDEMEEWTKALFFKSDEVDLEYKFEHSNRSLRIVLRKTILDKIIELARNDLLNETL